MKDVIEILKALCGNDEKLFNEVSEEIKDAITYEVRDGIRQANTEGVLRLAMQLECSQYPTSVKNFHKAKDINLANTVRDPELKKMLGQPGISDGGIQDA